MGISADITYYTTGNIYDLEGAGVMRYGGGVIEISQSTNGYFDGTNSSNPTFNAWSISYTAGIPSIGYWDTNTKIYK